MDAAVHDLDGLAGASFAPAPPLSPQGVAGLVVGVVGILTLPAVIGYRVGVRRALRR
jgi:hypothetical protein